MTHSVAVDVGGTHVRLASSRRSLSFPTPSNLNDLPALVRRALARLGPRPTELRVGMRGVWTAAEQRHWRRRFAPLAATVTVLSDAQRHHERIFRGRRGVLLNAGTGSIAIGQKANGTWVRAGGLGPLVGDEGSAFWIGREFLKRSLLKTRSFSAVRSYLNGDRAVARLASLAPSALNAAKRNNAVALDIVAHAADHLIDLANETGRLIGGRSVRVAVVGGLFQNPWFRRFFARCFTTRRLKKLILSVEN